MTFQREWDAHKAATERPTQTQLNGATTPGGGDSKADLIVHDDELGKIGNIAYRLHGRVQKTADDARAETHTAAVHLLNEGGLDELAGALLKVNDNWNTEVGTLKEGFGLISNHLDFTRKRHAEDERDIVLGMKDAAGRAMTRSRISDYIHNDYDQKSV